MGRWGGWYTEHKARTHHTLCLCHPDCWNGREDCFYLGASPALSPFLWPSDVHTGHLFSALTLYFLACVHLTSHLMLPNFVCLPVRLPFKIRAVMLSALTVVLPAVSSAGLSPEASLAISAHPLPALPIYFVELDGELLHLCFQPVGVGQLQGVTRGAGTTVPAGNGRGHLPLGPKQPAGGMRGIRSAPAVCGGSTDCPSIKTVTPRKDPILEVGEWLQHPVAKVVLRSDNPTGSCPPPAWSPPQPEVARLQAMDNCLPTREALKSEQAENAWVS